MRPFATLFILLSVPAWAQTFTDSHRPAAPYVESADRPAETLIENFDKAATQFLLNTIEDQNGNTGFTFGTSPFNFQIGQAFELPAARESASILGADLYFANVATSPLSSSYVVEVWDGTPTTGPTMRLYTESFPISGIQTDPAMAVATEVRFAAPVPVSANSFFLVLPFSENVPDDSLALGSTGQAFPTVIDETWHFFNASWTRTNALITSGGNPLQTYVWVDALADIVAVAAEPLPGAVTSVQTFPNPIRHTGTVDIELAESADVRVSLMDMLGREVAEVFDGRLLQGRRALDLDVSGLRASSYLVRVEVDGGVITRLLSVLR
ncbi:MAG: T9SS type A sorting domain-containing protein [Bacteroidota bacterium]